MASFDCEFEDCLRWPMALSFDRRQSEHSHLNGRKLSVGGSIRTNISSSFLASMLTELGRDKLYFPIFWFVSFVHFRFLCPHMDSEGLSAKINDPCWNGFTSSRRGIDLS
jgi:hypothetical protein